MKSPSLLLAPLLALAAGHASGEDWARIAAETDEPGFAMRIVEVEPDSPAEVAGLKPGDYVYQLGESGVRRISRRQREHEETVFYCPTGGRKATATLPREAMGVRWVESFRPQLDYLRGEIGTPDLRWDAAAVTALAHLETDPPGAEVAWAEAKRLGYPDDELDAFVRAFCAWRLRRPIPAREAYEAVVGEFAVMPHLYVHGYHPRFGSFIRVAAFTGEEEGDAVGSRLLAEIELGRERYSRRDWVSCRGGYDQGKRSVWLGEESIPAEDELEEGASPAMSRPFRIDIVRIDREIAIYSDGVSYCHLPVDPDHRPNELLFFATGIEVDFDDLQVWKLDP